MQFAVGKHVFLWTLHAVSRFRQDVRYYVLVHVSSGVLRFQDWLRLSETCFKASAFEGCFKFSTTLSHLESWGSGACCCESHMHVKFYCAQMFKDLGSIIRIESFPVMACYALNPSLMQWDQQQGFMFDCAQAVMKEPKISKKLPWFIRLPHLLCSGASRRRSSSTAPRWLGTRLATKPSEWPWAPRRSPSFLIR